MAHHCLHLFLRVPCFTGRGCAKPLSHSAHAVHHGSSLYASVFVRALLYRKRMRQAAKPQRAHGAPWLIIVCVCFACALLYRERMRQAEIAFAEKEAGPRAVPQPSAYAHKPNTLGKSKERTCVNCFLGARSHTCFCTQT